MNDVLAEYLKRYGLLAVLAALVFAVAVWGSAHWAAAPGEKVSVLWGLAEYTKPPEIHDKIQTESKIATQLTSDPLATPAADSQSSDQLDQINLEVVHGLSSDNYLETVEALRSRHVLRNLRPLETDRPIEATPQGSFFFVYSNYIQYNPKIDEPDDLLNGRVILPLID